MTGVARSSRCRFVLARAIRPKETEPSLFQWMPNCVAERQVGGREPLSKQILEEAAQMRGRRLVAEWALARKKMLHERHDIPGVRRRQVEHAVAEAMVEESISEAQNVIDRARAEATLPDEIGFEAGRQFGSFGLCRRKRRLCHYADFDEMLNEPLGKTVNLDLTFRCGRQAPSQLNSEVRRQRLWRNPFGLDQSAEASKQAAVIFESPRLVVLRGKAFLEGRKIRVKASNLVGCVHSCAPVVGTRIFLPRPVGNQSFVCSRAFATVAKSTANAGLSPF